MPDTYPMFYTPNDDAFIGTDDRESIQNAVDAAVRDGTGKVVIPAFNRRTGCTGWTVSHAVLLPSSIHVVLDNCTITQTDGVYDNVFRNASLYTPGGCTLEGEQHDIRITGEGNAVIDGGPVTGLDGRVLPGNPAVIVRNQIVLHNVRDFSVENITFRNPKAWALNFIFCRRGRIAGLTLDCRDDLMNQDGIDLRAGCRDIVIENIRGMSGDDLVALTGLSGEISRGLGVEGKSADIEQVTIRNIVGTAVSKAIVSMRNQDGIRIRDITVDTVIDTAGENEHPYAALRIGQKYYNAVRWSEPGETTRIHVRNIHSRKLHAVVVNMTLTDSDFDGIYCGKDSFSAVTTHVGPEATAIAQIRTVPQGAFIRNTTFRNIHCEEPSVKDYPAVDLRGDEDRDGLENVLVDSVFPGTRSEAVRCGFPEGLTVGYVAGK